MEIILSVLLFISMITNLVLLKYQPTVYYPIQPESILINEFPSFIEEQIVKTPSELIESEVCDDIIPDKRSNREYNPWKNEKGIQESFPNSSSQHKPAPPLKPLERPYGFSR